MFKIFFYTFIPLFRQLNVQFVCLIKVGVPAMHPQRTALDSITTRLANLLRCSPADINLVGAEHNKSLFVSFDESGVS